MITFTKRNLKLYFRNKGAVLFSLLAVFIVIALYAMVLGDTWVSDMQEIKNAENLMNHWLMAGILAIASVTTTLGAFGAMVEDRAKKAAKDFFVSPMRKSSITGGYLASSFIIGIIMSTVSLIVLQIYILAKGGDMLSVWTIFKTFLLILLCSLANTALVGFIVSFFKTNNTFSSASTVIGTLIGFLTGIYVPLGSLPSAVQLLIKLFPPSHGAALLRQVIMEDVMVESFAQIPTEYLTEFQEMMGITYKLGTHNVSFGMSTTILILTGVIFYTLTILNLSRKQN